MASFFSNLSRIDKNHAEFIEHENCKLIKYHSSSHLIAQQLRESGELKSIVEENLDITTTNAGVTSTYVVSVVPTIHVASGVAVTVGSGKSMIIDVLQIGGM